MLFVKQSENNFLANFFDHSFAKTLVRWNTLEQSKQGAAEARRCEVNSKVSLPMAGLSRRYVLSPTFATETSTSQFALSSRGRTGGQYNQRNKLL